MIVSTLQAQDENQLYEAIKSSNTSLIKTIISDGYNLNLRDQYGQLPIHHAVRFAVKTGDTSIINLLIENGADINAENIQGESPIVMSYINPKVVDFFINSGADINVENSFGTTPLHWAVLKQEKAFVDNR